MSLNSKSLIYDNVKYNRKDTVKNTVKSRQYVDTTQNSSKDLRII